MDMKPLVDKTTAAQEVYIRRNAEVYSDGEQKNVRYFLDAFLYKYQLANYSLEQLWSIRDAKVENNILAIALNSISALELTDGRVVPAITCV